MKPSEALIDAIYRERVLRARRTSFEDKFRAGPQLFASVCERMAAGLRDENPEADDGRVGELLEQRLQLLERLRGPR